MYTDYRILQANTNHCRAAQDLLVQVMAEWLVNVAVVAEPYSIPSSWLGDEDGLVALAARSSTDSPPLSLLERGPGYVAAAWGEVALVGVYFSPNRPLQDFENYLGVLAAVIGRAAPRQVSVLGDLNAKSVTWGNPATDPRGRAVELWAASSGLSLLNRGNVQTCVRRQGGSIVDVTFATPALAARVLNWRVELVETMSDHRYVRFDISTGGPGGTRPPSGRPAFPRWAVTRLDREAAAEAAFVQDWLSPPSAGMDVDTVAGHLRESLTEVCNSSMPRSGRPLPNRAVYWWSVELEGLRATCVEARRAYARSRRRRRRDHAHEDHLYAVYIEAKLVLGRAIADARDSARAELLEGLDRDPYGRPYKAARNKLRPFGPPVVETLEPSFLDGVVQSLFPCRDNFTPPVMDPPGGIAPPAEEEEEAPPVTESELSAAIVHIRAKKTAPGPDGVPARVVAIAATQMEERFRDLFSACLASGRFPKPWKEGQLCLLRKEGRPADSPSAYRPIVLLDEVGKMFEGIIAARLKSHLRNVGPDLSDAQFGFRAERSTVDALARLKGQVKEAMGVGDGLLAVSFDIANAFNSVPHSTILEALRFHGVPLYLRRLLASYLEDRSIVLVNRAGQVRRYAVGAGVPQGSVLGPPLWNVGYDWLLRGTLLRGTSVVCYADDTLLTARGESFREAANLASAGGSLVAGRIRRLGLTVALHKTEAVFFHGPRQRQPPDAHIFVEGVRIGVKAQMKYLGLVLDSRWRFGPHFSGLSSRLLKTAGALAWLLPNSGGPGARCRQLYAGILKSMALYGAPIWEDSLHRRENAAALRAPQRAIAQRVARAYRTVGFAAACALAGTPPWELEAWVLARVYEWTAGRRARGERPGPPQEREAVRREARDAIVVHWTADLATAAFGRRTLDAVGPVLRDWLDRSHGSLSFRLVQVLSGHGCFGSYLHRIGREETPSCHDCGAAEDTAQHTLEVCPSWSGPRRDLTAAIGQDLSLPGVVNAMLGDERSWAAVASFCEHVMSQKEAAERAREDDPLAAPLRRRRRGRRRRQYDSHLRLLPGGSQQATGAGAPSPVLHRLPPVQDGNGQVFPAIPVAPQQGGHAGPAS